MVYFTTKKVQPIKVIAVCECGGEMKPTGITLMTNPCRYPHECNKCGRAETYDCKYPKIEYEEGDE